MMPPNGTLTKWHPAHLFSNSSTSYALLVLNQPLDNLDMLDVVWRKASFRIAADGGANRLATVAQDPRVAATLAAHNLNVICGDLDSVTDEVLSAARARGTLVAHDPDQYSTDFTKCYRYIRKHVPRPLDMVVLGGLGGRVDQGIATLNHLYGLDKDDAGYRAGRLYLVSSEAMTFLLKTGEHEIEVQDEKGILGTNVGIIPKSPCAITTRGLQWDVEDWRTEWGGRISTSNYVREKMIRVGCDGDVLFTIDYSLDKRSGK